MVTEAVEKDLRGGILGNGVIDFPHVGKKYAFPAQGELEIGTIDVADATIKDAKQERQRGNKGSKTSEVGLQGRRRIGSADDGFEKVAPSAIQLCRGGGQADVGEAELIIFVARHVGGNGLALCELAEELADGLVELFWSRRIGELPLGGDLGPEEDLDSLKECGGVGMGSRLGEK
jgi:hypothetical protein